MTTPADKTLDDVEANAGAIREEDAFDVAAVAQWLRENAHPEADTSGLDGTPEVRQFTGGASNLTYLLRYPERDLILRRPPSGTKAKGAHDMRREHDIQRALAPHFPAVAPMVASTEVPRVILRPSAASIRSKVAAMRSLTPSRSSRASAECFSSASASA